jgi:hypothetical protein
MSDDDFPFAIGFFGPAHMMKDYERQVAPPIGQACLLCGEAIAEGDIGTIDGADQVTHYECRMRGVIGSVGHQLRRCSCFGGTEEDPPGMSRRQAAQAACALWETIQRTLP